ncbi:MAG TPA: hypothetical protein DCE18_13590 [Syntrophobacteraceae bacterium]|nr:hypothetical protein [Syntrophobacteraceae bacterium]
MFREARWEYFYEDSNARLREKSDVKVYAAACGLQLLHILNILGQHVCQRLFRLGSLFDQHCAHFVLEPDLMVLYGTAYGADLGHLDLLFDIYLSMGLTNPVNMAFCAEVQPEAPKPPWTPSAATHDSFSGPLYLYVQQSSLALFAKALDLLLPRVGGGGRPARDVALASFRANGRVEHHRGTGPHPLALRLLLVVLHVLLFVGRHGTGSQLRGDMGGRLERYGRIIRPILVFSGRSGLAFLRPDTRILLGSHRSRCSRAPGLVGRTNRVLGKIGPELVVLKAVELDR